jgi:high affinity cGMP-specific 3',5'-cyclic phosphodiesterase 9
MSPLENHHCAVSFKILSSPECNIFTNLSPEEFKEVRGVSTITNQTHMIYMCILRT